MPRQLRHIQPGYCYHITTRCNNANPKAARMQQGFFYDFSNYGIHKRLSDDFVWHPAFLQLGKTLEECAAKYRQFYKNYRPQPKLEKRNRSRSRLLAGVMLKGKLKKSPGQMSLPWDNSQVSERTQVHEVAEKFIQANCFNPRSDAFVFVPGIGSLKH